jgi:hypothetical protein
MINTHDYWCIMSDRVSTIGDGIEKVANDITTAAEAALPVLANLTFDFALHAAFTALLS